MHKAILIAALSCLSLTLVTGQSMYADSILAYQSGYKKDLYTVIEKDTAYVRFYPVDPNYRVVANVEKLYARPYFQMATSDKGSREAIQFAKLTFVLGGKEYVLLAYQLSSLLSNAKYKDNFFIPFTDETSGGSSYGGGRYLDFVLADLSPANSLVIDFNKSYNPYCAFRSGYSCPIPPPENELQTAIKAGEMNFSGHTR